MRRRLLVGGGVIVSALIGWWIHTAGDERTSSTASQRTGTRIGKAVNRETGQPVTLSGRVASASNGAAIQDALVALSTGRHVEVASPIVLRSGADGRWLASDVTPGTYVLSVTAAGFVPVAREIAVAQGKPQADVDVQLEPGGIQVTGRITTENQEPISNARIRAYRDVAAPSFLAYSGTDGRYEISLSPGPYQFEVTHDEYRRTWKNITTDETPMAVDFVLIRGGVIRGQVIARDTGKPVPDATVQAVGARDGSTGRAASDGTFTLRGLHDGTILVLARGQGYASSTPTIVELDPGEQATEVRVSVDPAVSIAGRVVAKDDHSLGIGGAEVTASGVGERNWPVSGVSDDDGNFELVGMLPGAYTLSADKRGMLFEGGVQVQVDDADIAGVLIEMRRGATISGRVDPPAVAQIGLARTGSDPFLVDDKDAISIYRAPTESDASGAFTLRDIPSGTFEITAMTRDGMSGAVPVSVSGADQSGLVVRLSPRASVSGRVVDTAGHPVAGQTVISLRLDVPLATRFRRDGIHRGATTAADGSFKIVGLDAGRWQLVTTGEEKVEVDLGNATERTGVTITIEARDETIRGIVLGPDGKPAVRAQVHAMREIPSSDQRTWAMPSRPVRTDSDGSFLIEKLRAGTYTVVAESKGGASKASSRGVTTGSSVTVVLSPLSSLTIDVGLAGAPARAVHLICWGPHGGQGLDATVDGSHTFNEVAQGEYQCETLSEDGSAKASVVVGRDPARLTLVLQKHASVTGVAVGALTGETVTGLTVMARGTVTETDADGRFVLERVPAGSGELHLMPKDQLGVGLDKQAYTAKPGERVDLGRIKVVPPRIGDVGTFGLSLEIRDEALMVTKVKTGGPAERAGIKAGDRITTIDSNAVAALGMDLAQRLLVSEAVAVGSRLTLTLGSGARPTITAEKW